MERENPGEVPVRFSFYLILSTTLTLGQGVGTPDATRLASPIGRGARGFNDFLPNVLAILDALALSRRRRD